MATQAVPVSEAGASWRNWVLASRHTVPAIFLLALGLRLALILFLPQQPASDGAFYVDRALEMAAGLGYQEQGHPTAFWPVGYPAVLALSMLVFGPNLIGPMLLNLVGAAVILWLVLWFGRSLSGSESVARLAGLLYALYPAHIAYTGAPLSETVSTAVTMGAFALLIARRRSLPWLFAAGLLFGVATLMRAQTLAFPFGAVIALAIIYRDFSWRQAAIAGLAVYLGLFSAVLPWSMRNTQVLGSFVLVSTNGGIGLHAGANDMADGGYFQVERSPLWAEVGIPWEKRIVRQVELDERLGELAKEWIREDPVRWLALGPTKVFLVWQKDGDGLWSLKSDYPHLSGPLTAVQWLNQLYYAVLLLLGAFCFLLCTRALLRRHDPLRPMALLLCMPAFVSLIAFFFTGQTRYHYPAMPFIIVAAAWTLVHLTRLPIRGGATR